MGSLSRRRFLACSAAACGAGALAPLLRPGIAVAEEATHTLVVVSLDGGLDGISALVPAGDPDYARRRRWTRIDAGRVRGIDATFGLHPSLGPLVDLWQAGLVAAVPAIGSLTGTRSHFYEMSVVADGMGGVVGDGSGWLARHLRSLPTGGTLRGVATGAVPSPELVSDPLSFWVRDLHTLGVGSWQGQPQVPQALADVYAAASPPLAGAAAVAFEAVQLVSSSGAADQVTAVGYPNDPFGAQLRSVAQLLRAGIGVEAATVRFDGFDTHSNQGGESGRLAAQLDTLARGLWSFANDLRDRLDRVTVVVLSEFGRRVDENGSAGTDHGRGGLAFVLGSGISSGIHGTWPGLADDRLDQGDLRVTTDVRSLLAEIVAGRAGNPALDVVFPGFTPAAVGVA
jgi:uncharacterized protein (DUF1501 family)